MTRLLSASLVVLALACLPPALAGGEPATEPLSPDRVSLESVRISGDKDLHRLEQLGLDVTHDVTDGAATVALDSEAERDRLAGRGFRYETLIPDLQAKNSAERAAEARAALPTALPSGRTTYRVYEEYLNDLDALTEANPDFVRKFTVGQSLEGRDIIGIEIASEVNREDDGRPAYVQMGLHHVREWPSGEFPMEFAIELVNGYNAGDPRVTDIVENVRTFIVPVVNPDGFLVSRGAAISGSGGGGLEGIGIVAGAGEYKRKNCRPTGAGQEAIPCAQRPANSGVDLNRNYGYYWGGPGASTSATSESYRGTGPFSEPESEAVHQFVSKLHPTVVITNHTFTENGWWLRQPGFNGAFFPQEAPTYSPACINPPNNPCAVTPDEPAMKALGDAMGDQGTDNPALGATGWPSDLGWELGDITGATEDWNYFAQGTYGYTPEARGTDFHALYQQMVVAEYGDPSVPGKGVREAFLLAGEEAMNTANHGVITGTVPPGATLKLHKEFDAPRHPNNGGAPTHEVLDTTLAGPAGGTYEWHVMPSDRPQIPASPLPAGDEEWTMTCQQPGQGVFTADVEVGRGQQVTVDWAGGPCGTDPVSNLPPVADFDFSPAAPEAGRQVTFVSTSADPDGAIDPADTRWDLDDDGQFDDATGLTATHTFGAAGTFDVALQVTDDDGAPDTETKQVTVAPAVNLRPAAGFTFFPLAPAPGQDVTFTSTSSDPDGELEELAWDFDADGQFDDALGGQVTRGFNRAGSYPISLRATDDEAGSDVATRTVIVGGQGALPAATPSSRTDGPCHGQAPTLLGTSGDDVLRGTAADDVIAALGGDDRIFGMAGNDTACGGSGDDRIGGGAGGDALLGGQDDDRLRGRGGSDVLRGGQGDDRGSGGAGRDRCGGGSFARCP